MRCPTATHDPRGFVALLAVWGALNLAAADAVGSKPVSFNRDIRPILSDNCFACHGPDQNTRKARLRLDQQAGAMEVRDGRAAVVAGDPEQSELVKRILSTDPDELMPPPESRKRLTPAQRGLLKQWISQGAGYEGHWAYTPPQRPPVPGMDARRRKGSDQRPRLHPIDSFVEDRLSRDGMKMGPSAPPRILIRRLSLDLLGLPPTPRDVEAFARDHDPSRYEEWVDRFLASPHYGERMAVPWLDLVRYGDTVGFHGDMPVSVWPYRDYVIQSFNRNLRYDQFTREQLGGDLIPNAAPDQRVASAYNRLNRMSTEGGIQDKEYRAKYLADRVRTTSTTWMGVTMGCAECHDHKFDPFTIRDFYSFGAFFADLNEKGFYDRGYSAGDWGPQMRVLSFSQEERLRELERLMARADEEAKAVSDEQLASSRDRWVEEIRQLQADGQVAWNPLLARASQSSGGSKLLPQADRSVLASVQGPALDDYTVEFQPDGRAISHLMIEVLPDDSFPGNGLARAGESFFISEIEVGVREGAQALLKHVAIRAVRSDLNLEDYPAVNLIDGNPDTVWGQGPIAGGVRRSILTLTSPLKPATNASIVVTVRHSRAHPYQHTGRFRVSSTPFSIPNFQASGMPGKVLEAIKAEPGKQTEEGRKALVSHFRSVAPELHASREAKARWADERSLLLGSTPATLVSQKGEPRTIRILARGDWMNDKGDVVLPSTPASLGSQDARGRRLNRLDLADWLVSRDNPLTARAFVNRLWKQFFGAGLSRTLDDLGLQGEWPSHPELLDWLAVEFMDSGWNVKHVVRLIVTSRTYQQSAARTSRGEELDPLNRLLARQSSLRLEAEFVRDNALAISGLLARGIGGPSVRPYQPVGYYAPLNFPKREYAPDIGFRQHRRGVYTHWQRSFPHPSLVAFDAPSREECTAGRPVSNTPLQALVLLNDPTYVEAARAFAGRVITEGGRTFEQRLDFAYRTAIARPPRREESRLLAELHRDQTTRYESDPTAAAELLSVGVEEVPAGVNRVELASWTVVARAVLNLHETITRN